MIEELFAPDRTEASIIAEFAEMRFELIGMGNSACVLGDTNNQLVLKVFPPLNVGAATELVFIKKNPILALADRTSLRMENVRMMKWARQRAKTLVAASLSRKNVEQRKLISERSICGYEACVDRGLMACLPTRVISNCISKLSISGSNRLMRYLVAPARIIMQRRFDDKDLAIHVLRERCVKKDAFEQCRKLVENAVKYQLMMWRTGLVCKDGAFNVFENSIVLPDGSLQLHDANDVGDSLDSALRFVRAKEQDIQLIFSRLDAGEYPELLYDTNFSSVAETARKLYGLLPADRRDNLVMFFLQLARETLSENTLRENWEASSFLAD